MINRIINRIKHAFLRCAAAIGRGDVDTERLKSQTRRIALTLIVYLSGLLVLIGVFFIIGETSGKWDLGWAVLIGGGGGGLIALSVESAVRNIARNKPFDARLALFTAVELAVVGAYLAVSVIEKAWTDSWIILLFLPVFIALADMVFSAATKRRKELLASTLIFIPLLFTMVYIPLCYLTVLPWHPYWLIIAAAFVIDAIIIGCRVLKKLK